MTLPDKGSRRIVVDDRTYRWAVRPRPTYWQGIGARMTVAVERLEGHAQTLSIVIPMCRPDNYLGEDGYRVTPRAITRWVRKALDAGWEPDGSGPKFELRLELHDLEASQVHPGALRQLNAEST